MLVFLGYYAPDGPYFHNGCQKVSVLSFLSDLGLRQVVLILRLSSSVRHLKWTIYATVLNSSFGTCKLSAYVLKVWACIYCYVLTCWVSYKRLMPMHGG